MVRYCASPKLDEARWIIGEEKKATVDGSLITDIPKSSLEGKGIRFSELVVKSGLAKSLGDVRRTVNQGGLFLNDLIVKEPDQLIKISDLIKGSLILMRRGKKNYSIVRIIT